MRPRAMPVRDWHGTVGLSCHGAAGMAGTA